MSDGILSDLDFEKHIGEMQDRQLLEFVARQMFETGQRCVNHNERISTLENGSKKLSGIVGGISGTITAVIIGLIGYFTNRS